MKNTAVVINGSSTLVNGMLLDGVTIPQIYAAQPPLTEDQIKRAAAFLDDVVPQLQNQHPGQTTEEYVASLEGGLLGLKDYLIGKNIFILTYAKDMGSSLYEIILEIVKISDGKIDMPIEDVSDKQIEELADKLCEVNEDANLIPENVSAKNFIKTIGLHSLYVLVGATTTNFLQNADDLTDKLDEAYEGIEEAINQK